MGFMDLEKACDKVNREALWQVLRVRLWDFAKAMRKWGIAMEVRRS